MSLNTINIDDLNKKQYSIAKKITETPASTTKYHIVRASRQSGKTFLFLRLAIYFAFEKHNQKICIVSGYTRQFKDLWSAFMEIIPEELIADISLGDSIITFVNKSKFFFGTAQNYNAIVGPAYDYLLCDEVALYPAKALSYITPTIAAKKNAKAVFVSTPRGKNEFYDYCMMGANDDPYIVEHRMSYLDNENYDIREIEKKKLIMPEILFRSEYLGEFAFGSSSVFGEFAKYQTVMSFEEPIPGEEYYGGIDVGGTGEDSTVLTILNRYGKPVCIFEPTSESLPGQADELAVYIRKYNDARIKVECNGLGIGLYDMLSLNSVNISKFWTSNFLKNDIVKRMLLALSNGDLALPHIDLYSKLDSEMTSYIATRTASGQLTYSHEKNFHDDALDSYMIANYCKEVNIHGAAVEVYSEQNDIKQTNTPSAKDYRDYMDEEYY